MLKEFFADLHVHIGRSNNGRAVKITASANLTFANIVDECLNRKGIDIIGIVDCASGNVLTDIDSLIKAKQLMEMPEGGLLHKDRVTVILGSEIETLEPNGGHAHFIGYFPFLKQIKEFNHIMARYIKNIDLSSQQCRLAAAELWAVVKSCGGVLVPAHAFTPHKSIYGNCAERMSELFSQDIMADIPALELGLSADTYLADRLAELISFSFLSNSDAHSLPKIAREYNIFLLEKGNFKEFMLALRRQQGRKITANFGLDPKLGKYHRTFCLKCNKVINDKEPPVLDCPVCGEKEKVVAGVLDRIKAIEDYPDTHSPEHRPPYCYQVPLEFIPGVGKKNLDKLIKRFGSEMAVLHKAKPQELEEVVSAVTADLICRAREGTLTLQAGGGGKYGKVENKDYAQLLLFEQA